MRSQVMPTESIPVKPVILCGGSGTRLWHMSRTQLTKQFLALVAPDRRLLPDTVARADAVSGGMIPMFVCTTADRCMGRDTLVRKECKTIPLL